MKITVAATEADFDHAAASRIVDRICANPRAVIGLSTGRTTGNIHREVAAMHARTDFDISALTLFGLDEVTGVDREYAGACYKMLLTEIVAPLGIKENQFIMLPTRSADFEAACTTFTDELDRRGGIDLLMLGLGENGHLGFNQPGTPFGTGAWKTVMDPVLEARIRRETNTPEGEELGGVTLGIRDIMRARRIVLVAKGANKRDIVKQMLEAPVSEDIPATILRLHPDCEFLLDSESAAAIDIEKLRAL
ncbi:MAG: glucosamine-6-phosphate deaminase [Bacteroidales bacterium]|nr:glucosamine-6-phosphate deaminase [Bacteroidales bacterium]